MDQIQLQENSYCNRYWAKLAGYRLQGGYNCSMPSGCMKSPGKMAGMASFREWRSGFSLIEILASLAIIVVLSALLFPTFKRILEQKRLLQCTSNMRQIGMALNQYSIENNNKYPGLYEIDQVPLQDKLNPYIGIPDFPQGRFFRSKVWFCPSATVINHNYDYRQYGYNWYVNQSIGSGGQWNLQQNVVPAPASYIVFGEMNDNSELVDPRAFRANLRDTTGKAVSIYRMSHSGGANYLFGDGHIEYRNGPIEALTGSPWNWWY